MATFEQAYNWNVGLGPYENYSFIGAPALLEVSDGSGDQNILFATLVNKLHKLLRAQQLRAQYTATTNAFAPIVVTKKAIYHVQQQNRSPNLFQGPSRISIPFTFLPGDVDAFGSELQFSVFGFLATATGYSESNGARAYFPVSCGVSHVPYTLTINVNVIKTRSLNTAANVFRYGDVIEATCMFIWPQAS